MTIATTASLITIPGTGSLTVFDYNFIIPYASDGITPEAGVYFTNAAGATVLLAPNTYTITGVGDEAGGTVVYSPAIAAGTYLSIVREVPYTQPDAFPNQGFYPRSVEIVADMIEQQIQQLRSGLSFAITLPITDPAPPPVLPGAPVRKNQVVGFDQNGALVLFPTVPPTVTPTQVPIITWDTSVTSQVAAPTGSETPGTRYLVKNGTGIFAAYSNHVAELSTWNLGWLFSAAPQPNQTLEVGQALYRYGYAPDTGGYIWRGIVQRRVKFDSGSYLVLEGDSIAAGSLASSPGVNAFGALTATRYNLDLVNNAVGGKTTYQALVSAYATPNAHYAGSWPNGNYQIYLYEGGHNDCLYAARSPVLIDSVVGNDLTWWTKICAKTALAADDASYTRSGFSTSISGVLCMASAQLGGNGKFDATAGHTISGAFVGDNIVVWTYASDAAVARMSPFTLAIDGTVVLTYNGDGLYDNPANDSNVAGLCPRAVVYRGAGAGSHTFVITVVAGPGVVYIDSIGTLLEANRAPTTVFMQIPRPINYDIPHGGGSSPAVFESVDNARQNWIKGYAEYPIIYSRSMDWLSINNYNVDQEHPNTAGHLQLAESLDAITLALNDFDAHAFTFSINAWTISGGYTTNSKYTRNGSIVTVEYIIAPNNGGVNFTTTVAVSNVSLVPGLPFSMYSGFAEVINVTDGVPLGVGVMKSDSNGGGIYMPAINVTGKQIAIIGTYATT